MSATDLWDLYSAVETVIQAAIVSGGTADLEDIRFALVAQSAEIAAIQLRGYPSIAVIPGGARVDERYLGAGYRLIAPVDASIIVRLEDALRQASARRMMQYAAAIRDLLDMAALGVTGLQSFAYIETGSSRLLPLATVTGNERDVFIASPVTFEARIMQEV